MDFEKFREVMITSSMVRMQKELEKQGAIFKRSVTKNNEKEGELSDNEETVEPTVGMGTDSEQKNLSLNLTRSINENNRRFYLDNVSNSKRISELTANDSTLTIVLLILYLGSHISPFESEQALGNIIKNTSPDFTSVEYISADTAFDQFQNNRDFFKNMFDWESFDNGQDKLINHIIIDNVYGELAGVDMSFNAANVYTSKNNGLFPSSTSATILGQGGTILVNGEKKYTFESFGKDRTIVAHEYSHGVVRSKVKFDSSNAESAALNEALPDIFAAAITGRWDIVGAITNVATDGSSFIRDLSNPAKYTMPNDPSTPYPTKYSDLEAGIDGHYGGTIIGYQFYLLASGGNYAGHTIKGIGTNKAIKLVFNALDELPEGPTFKDYRAVMENITTETYGQDSDEYKALLTSLNATEIPK
ncbi:M4 family metallopeptidase [Lactiplantibacillus plantarum]|uniref:M4 family metallopeptidase n=1 Tax=Lactiplantibacillus plantarum TaxID=1590 RepID=UPI0020014374|nr:M4 family metallopeptidase [Lactiplantibacillus plantarum]